MSVVVVLLAMIAVIAVLVGAHWYVWRRLVHDTTRPGGFARRAGTAAVWVLPLLSAAALVSGRAGVPFRLEQLVAWPGYLWLAVLLYLVLALLVAEPVRALWLRRTRADETATPPAGSATEAAPGTSPEPAGPAPAPEPAAVPVPVTAPASGPGPVPGPVPAPEPVPTPVAPAPAADLTPVPTAEPPAPAPAPAVRPHHPSRRLFVSRAVGAGVAVAALGTVGHGTYGVLRGPRLKRVTVPLAKLPRSAHGLRIAVVSDIHLGPILGRGHTQRIVDTINSAQPDLVAVVGDMVDGSVADLGPAAEPLARLEARHGSFFVTGNHEYFSGAQQWVDHVRELGLRPLENERVEIAGGFDLAGVNDIAGESTGEGPDFARALGDRDRARAAVLLAHQPVVVHDAVDHGVDLQLSGHTHGGQLWPGNHLAALANPTVEGLERYGDTQLYVSRGAGAWGPPVRVGASSDITIVQLASTRA